MNDISPTDMISWFRAKASEFNRIADSLESTFSQTGKPTIKTPTQPANIESVKTIVEGSEKPLRYSTIADYLKADPEEVGMILKNNPNLFEQVGRGWWTLKS